MAIEGLKIETGIVVGNLFTAPNDELRIVAGLRKYEIGDIGDGT